MRARPARRDKPPAGETWAATEQDLRHLAHRAGLFSWAHESRTGTVYLLAQVDAAGRRPPLVLQFGSLATALAECKARARAVAAEARRRAW